MNPRSIIVRVSVPYAREASAITGDFGTSFEALAPQSLSCWSEYRLRIPMPLLINTPLLPFRNSINVQKVAKSEKRWKNNGTFAILLEKQRKKPELGENGGERRHKGDKNWQKKSENRLRRSEI